MTSWLTMRDLTPLFDHEPVMLTKEGYIYYYAWTGINGKHMVYSSPDHYTKALDYGQKQQS